MAPARWNQCQNTERSLDIARSATSPPLDGAVHAAAVPSEEIAPDLLVEALLETALHGGGIDIALLGIAQQVMISHGLLVS